jgi:hypothetical protein
MEEHFPSMHEALGLILSTTKNDLKYFSKYYTLIRWS